MLKGPVGLVVFMPGDVRFLVGGDDRAVALHERLHVPPMPRVVEQGVADAEPDAQPARLVEQRLGRVVRHRAFVPVIGLGDVVDEPAREERREGELRVHHQLDAVLSRLMYEGDHSGHDLLTGVIALNGAELRGGDRDDS